MLAVRIIGYLNLLLVLYTWVLIGSAIFSWLIAFNVVNVRNPIVSTIGRLLYQLTEPVLRPIRNALPAMGGIDISPVVVILIIIFIQQVIFPSIITALLT